MRLAQTGGRPPRSDRPGRRRDRPGGRDGRASRPRGGGRRWARRAVVTVLVAALIAAVGAIVVWRTGALTPSHPVPSLVGSSPATADQRLRPLHFHLAVSDRAYNARAAVGTIISQRPASGRLAQGGTIRVTLSLGPRPVSIPAVVGLNSTAATALLTYVGLQAEVAGHVASMTVPAGVVVSSSPAQGSLLPGQRVALVVSSGKPKVTVPAMQGAVAASFAAAQTALIGDPSRGHPDNRLQRHRPRGRGRRDQSTSGHTVVVGSSVAVVVSKGPRLISVPDVSGQSVGAASQILADDGFQVSGVTGNPIATVIGTAPETGAVVPFGSAVQIITD